jgi:hypothetical protein
MQPVPRALSSLGLVLSMALAACDGSETEVDTGQTSAALGSIVSRGTIWHYWDRGAITDPSWLRGWEEESWPYGSGPLGYGESYLATTVGYGGDPSHKNITTYFRHTTWLDVHTEDIAHVYADVMYDDGVILYVQGTRVWSAGMSATNPASPTELAVGHEAENKYVRVDLTPYRSLFDKGYIDVAAEVHQNDVASSDLVFDVSISYEGVVLDPGVLVPRDGTWSFSDQYIDQSGWQNGTTNPSGWRDGTAPLGYGETYVATTIAKPTSTQSPTTLYRYVFDVDDPASVSQLTGEVMYDDGVVVWLNGTRIDSLSMPAGAATFSTLALGHEAENTYVTRDWSSYRPLLLEHGNVLAVELHQVDRTSSDAVFDVSLRAGTAPPPPPPPPVTEDIPRGATWSYWDKGGDLGTAWRASSYDDSSWLRGRAPLGYGETYLATTVSYGPDASHKYRTTYFRNRFRIADHNAVTSLITDLSYDDGAVIYINGTEVKRLFMPTGTITASTLASPHETGNINYERYDLTAARNLLVDGDNVISVEVHQSSDSSSDLSFDLALDVTTGAPPPPPPPSSAGIPRKSFWKYFAGPSQPALDWANDHYFDDSAWPSRMGPIGYGESYIQIPISYGPDPANKYTTTYFRKSLVVEDPTLITKMAVDVMYDDGFILYINGLSVLYVGVPPGAPYGMFAVSHEANNTYVTFDISTFSKFLHVGENEIAVEVHQDSPDSSDLVFDLGLRYETSALPTSISRRSPWLYYNRGDLGSGWQNQTYTDGWDGGVAPLGYGNDDVTTETWGGVARQPTTTFFRRHFRVDAAASVVMLRGELLVDDGAVIYLNGQEIARPRMPAGDIGFYTRASSHESNGIYEVFDWSAHIGLLRAGENVIAVEVHEDAAHAPGNASNDLTFDLELEVVTADTPRIPGCVPVTPPRIGSFAGVWIAPDGTVWTAGDSGIIGRQTVSGWAWCSAEPNVGYSAVWGTANNDVWFAGSKGTVLRWNGTSFQRLDIGTSAAINDLWGSSATDVFVVLGDHTMRHFDGTTWRAAGEGIGYLSAVWGASSSDVWAVGAHQVPSPTGNDYEDLCSNDIYRWNPGAAQFELEQVFTIYYGGCGLAGVGGSGPTDVWALGDMAPAGAAAGFAFAAHYDGVSWRHATPPGDEFSIDRVYVDVAARAPGAENGAWIVSSGRGAVRFDGETWSRSDDALTGDLDAIDARGSAMYAVGSPYKIVRWNGSDWVRVR